MLPTAARCRFLLAGLATSAMLAAPATAAAAPAAGSAGCPEVAVARAFAPWGDQADYFLAPGGAFEHATASWMLRGGAAVGAGNEPFRVVAPGDTQSLKLPAGSAATSAPFCIGAEHRTMRFFARSARSSVLDVDVLYADARGTARSLRIGALAGNAMTVRLRFAPRGMSSWTIDDVHVDPYRGR